MDTYDTIDAQIAKIERGTVELITKEGLIEKLKRWDLLDLLENLPRNLNALLDKRDLAPT